MFISGKGGQKEESVSSHTSQRVCIVEWREHSELLHLLLLLVGVLNEPIECDIDLNVVLG